MYFTKGLNRPTFWTSVETTVAHAGGGDADDANQGRRGTLDDVTASVELPVGL
jgi:hypothetical protein